MIPHSHQDVGWLYTVDGYYNQCKTAPLRLSRTLRSS